MVEASSADPFRNADSRMHLAYSYYRTSQIENAKKELKKSKEKLDQADPETPHISVQICFWYLLNALMFSSNNVNKARKHASIALKLAKEGNYDFRRKQAELILAMLK